MVDTISITTPRTGTLSHVSWGSVFGGAFVAIAVMFVLCEMCMAIDLGLLKPLDPNKDAAIPAIAVGGAVAWVVSALIALFIGAWTAGHLARQTNETDTVLHGLLVWAVGLVLMVGLGATAVGSVMGGAFSLVSSGVQAAGSAAGGAVKAAGSVAGGAASGATEEAAKSAGLPSFNWDAIKNKAEKLVKAHAPGAQPAPGANGQDAGAAKTAAPGGEQTQPQAGQSATAGANANDGRAPGDQAAAGKPAQGDDQDGDEDLMALTTRLFGSSTATVSDADRKTLTSTLVAQAGMTQEQAGRQVQRWEDASKKAKEKYEQLKSEAEQKARRAAAATAKALSEAAWIGFVAMVLAASASMLGAHFGGPRRGKLVTDGASTTGHTHAP